jgi:hypothetical protein
VAWIRSLVVLATLGCCGEAATVQAAAPAVQRSADSAADLPSRRELRARWRRGNALIGVGVPLALGGAAMMAIGGASWNTVAVDRFDHDPPLPPPAGPIAMTLGGAAIVGGAVTMIVFGALDRRAVKRENRRRMSVSLMPMRRGVVLGAGLRF